MVIVSLYCDGGVIGRNPSSVGGTYAYCHVDAHNKRTKEYAGVVTPAEMGVEKITNNLTELLAAVCGMESLPDGWAGTIYTDSQITLFRIERRQDGTKLAGMNGVPPSLVARLVKARLRLGHYRVVLLGGHPTQVELASGLRSDGYPVSVHNVACDRMCCEMAECYLKRRGK